MNLCWFLAPTCQDLFQYAPACNPIQPISIQSNQKIDRIGKTEILCSATNKYSDMGKGYWHTLVQADQDPWVHSQSLRLLCDHQYPHCRPSLESLGGHVSSILPSLCNVIPSHWPVPQFCLGNSVGPVYSSTPQYTAAQTPRVMRFWCKTERQK